MVVISGNRLDVVTLTLVLCTDCPSAIDRFLGTLRVDRGRPNGKRVADQDGRDAPRRNGASRIAVECFTKGLFPLNKPEGMEQGHAALEATLCSRCAGISKSNRAKLGGWGATVMCVNKRSCREQSEQNGRQQSSTHDQILHRCIRNAISWQHRSHWAAVINVDKASAIA